MFIHFYLIVEEVEITLSTTIKLIQTPKMIKLLCLMLYSGILIGFIGGILAKLSKLIH